MVKFRDKQLKVMVQPRKGVMHKFIRNEFLLKLLTSPLYLHITCLALILVEIFLNLAIIRNVKYTEIDWIAYMQEVEGFLNGTLDYQFLKGDTGPLVYPAGFVYVYSFFYYLTSNGQDILTAQYIFIGIYVAQLYFAFKIYRKTAKAPPYALIITTLTSYRIHSIYVLRLFNDPIAVLFFYISLNAFLSRHWILGSVFYSLAVSIKMNILLYAPALLAAYLTNLSIGQTFINLCICAIIQLAVGAPFLKENPLSYLKGSFNLGRVFEHKWTVNYRFLDNDIFASPEFHIGLLVLHVSLLLLFLPSFKRYFTTYAKLDYVAKGLTKKGKSKKKKQNCEKMLAEVYEGPPLGFNFDRNVQLFVLPFFVANFIGMACARSLHYQFYSWYFHSLLYLVYCTGFPTIAKFLLLGVIELCWNTYPSTILSSLTLHVCHTLLLIGVYIYMKK